MKKLLTILSLLLCIGTVPALAQKGRFTVFSEDGDKFFLVADGRRINTTADFRVEAKDIPGARIRVKIIFQDTKKPSIDDVVYVKDFDNNYVYVTYVIRKKKDRYVLKWSDQDEEPNIPEWKASHQDDDEPATKPTKKPAPKPKPATPNDPSTDGPADVNITMPGVTIKAGETGFNMDVKDPEMTHTTTTTTTTTRKTSSRNNGQVTTTRTAPAEEAEEDAPAPKAASRTVKPITAQSYSATLANIKRQGFDDSKVKMAKLTFKNNALTTKQIAEILKLISFEQSRLDLAKEGYTNCLDKENYLNLTEVFSFSSSTDELTEFLSNQ